MPPEPGPLCHSDDPEGAAKCPTCQGGSGTVLETVARTGEVSQLLAEPDGELYWGLARHDESYRTLFGDARRALALLPELEDVVASLVPETTVVADIPSFLQKQIDSGELAFQVDRSGENLAHLVDRSGRMRHVLRLDMKRLTPGLSQAWSNLRSSAVQLEIMRGLCDIEEAVSAVRAGLQNDRLALVDTAWSFIEQARTVSDSGYRARVLDQALDKAVEGRAQLARSIKCDLDDLAKYRKHGSLGLLVDEATTIWHSQKSLTEKDAECAEQIVRAIAAMESATRAAALVHMHHGESDAARTTLSQFQDLLRERHLDDDAAITALNSFARKDQKPLLAQVLSTHTRALKICGMEPEALLVPSPGDAIASPAIDEEDPAGSGVVVPTCGECGRDIETGAALCAYHRGKKREKLAVVLMTTAGLAAGAAKKYGPNILKSAYAATKMIRL